MTKLEYSETEAIQFVRCDEIDSKNVHDSKLIDGCCSTCIELYEKFTDDIITDLADKFSKKNRYLKDFFEVPNNEGFPRLLKFGVILE